MSRPIARKPTVARKESAPHLVRASLLNQVGLRLVPSREPIEMLVFEKVEQFTFARTKRVENRPRSVRPKAAVNVPQSKRFARFEEARQSRQSRLEGDCGGFSAAFPRAPKAF